VSEHNERKIKGGGAKRGRIKKGEKALGGKDSTEKEVTALDKGT